MSGERSRSMKSGLTRMPSEVWIKVRDRGYFGRLPNGIGQYESEESCEPEDAIPPLENGDRLSRTEFERRYDAMPELKKAELIEGVVYMPSPVRLERHGRPHGLVLAWLGVYWDGTPGTDFADSPTARLDSQNEPQPDAILLIKPEHGGQAGISPGTTTSWGPRSLPSRFPPAL